MSKKPAPSNTPKGPPPASTGGTKTPKDGGRKS